MALKSATPSNQSNAEDWNLLDASAVFALMQVGPYFLPGALSVNKIKQARGKLPIPKPIDSKPLSLESKLVATTAVLAGVAGIAAQCWMYNALSDFIGYHGAFSVASPIATNLAVAYIVNRHPD